MITIKIAKNIVLKIIFNFKEQQSSHHSYDTNRETILLESLSECFFPVLPQAQEFKAADECVLGINRQYCPLVWTLI